MSREDLWTRAANAMREDEDPRWNAVADWLRAEAWAQDAMEPFVEMLNMAMEAESGIKGHLKFGRKADGDIAMLADTNEGATAVAEAYLRAETDEPAPAHHGTPASEGGGEA